MVCDINKISSNDTGTMICEEVCPGELDATAANRKFFTRESNGYQTFGGNITSVPRQTINPLRKNKKGTITDIESGAGWGEDFTQNNMSNLLQGFFVRSADEKYNLHPMLLSATPNPCVDVEAGNGIYNVTSTLATSIYVGDLVKTTGFTNSVNNTMALVTGVTTTELDTDNSASVVESSPPTYANIRVVGHQFASGDLVATVVSNKLVLTSSAYDMTQLNLKVGEWIFIGGDSAGTQFANGTGYARVYAISATAITCDKVAGLAVADAGVGKTIRIFFGTYLRDAITTQEILERTYLIQRTLGEDANGTQAQVIVGAYANEFALKVASNSKLEVDLSYIGMDEELYDGTQTIPSDVANVVVFPALGEEAFNTSSSMVRMKMSLVEDSLSPSEMFGFATDLNINISNGYTLDKAIGVIGAIGASSGNFTVTGAVTAYFQTIEAQRALRDNADVTIDAIFAQDNGGFIFDIPLLSLSGGVPNVAFNEPITIPLEQSAAESALGHTLAYCNFPYLPTVAMP